MAKKAIVNVPTGAMTLEFVRMATEADPATTRQDSLWRVWQPGKITDDESQAESWWLQPGDVQSYRLTDHMREALNEQMEPSLGMPVEAPSGPREGHSEATAGPDGAEGPTDDSQPEGGPSGASPIQVLSGSTMSWRWQAVDIDPTGQCGRVWAIDNKPQIEAWKKLNRPDLKCPEFQHIILPDEILRVIVGMDKLQLAAGPVLDGIY